MSSKAIIFSATKAYIVDRPRDLTTGFHFFTGQLHNSHFRGTNTPSDGTKTDQKSRSSTEMQTSIGLGVMINIATITCRA